MTSLPAAHVVTTTVAARHPGVQIVQSGPGTGVAQTLVPTAVLVAEPIGKDSGAVARC